MTIAKKKKKKFIVAYLKIGKKGEGEDICMTCLNTQV